MVATKGASSRIGTVLDDLVAQVASGFQSAIEHKIEGLANDVKRAIGAPASTATRSAFATTPVEGSVTGLAARGD